MLPPTPGLTFSSLPSGSRQNPKWVSESVFSICQTAKEESFQDQRWEERNRHLRDGNKGMDSTLPSGGSLHLWSPSPQTSSM